MLENIIYIELIIIGIYTAFREGAPMGFVRQDIERYIHPNLHYLMNPLFNCIACMGGVWGFTLTTTVLDYDLVPALLASISLIGLGYVVSSFLPHDD